MQQQNILDPTKKIWPIAKYPIIVFACYIYTFVKFTNITLQETVKAMVQKIAIKVSTKHLHTHRFPIKICQ